MTVTKGQDGKGQWVNEEELENMQSTRKGGKKILPVQKGKVRSLSTSSLLSLNIKHSESKCAVQSYLFLCLM